MMKIEYSHLDRMIYPKDGLIKKDIIDYYKKIAPVMLPHMHDHLFVMQRFPSGIDHDGFYQKQVPDYFPDWFSKKKVRLKTGGSCYFGIIQTKEDLLYVANQLVLTPHLWLSTSQKPNYPDKIIFDLDPGNNDINLLREIAVYIRDVLEDKKLEPFLMTTGSRGFHVVAPIKQTNTFAVVRNFVKKIAQDVVAQYPKDCTISLSKAARGNKLFIDYLRNGYGQTAVAPYALRPLPGAPVATPVEWRELAKITSQSFTIRTVFDRIKKKGDAWQHFKKYARELII